MGVTNKIISDTQSNAGGHVFLKREEKTAENIKSSLKLIRTRTVLFLSVKDFFLRNALVLDFTL